MTRVFASQGISGPLLKVFMWVAFLSAAMVQLQANVFGVCELDSTFGAGGISSAQYATAVVTAGCIPGFSSNLAAGAAVSPTSLPPGLTTASLSLLQPMPFGGNAVATSTASLDQGVLRVLSNTEGVIGNCGGTCTTTDGVATSQSLFDDTLHFTIAGGASSEVGTLFAHLDGGLATQNTTESSYSVSEEFSLGGAGAGCWATSGEATAPYLGPCQSGNYGFLTSSFTNQSATGFDFSGTFSIANGQSNLLFADLNANCAGGQLCDFSNTASFSVSLPSDVTYTSDSGVLFSQPVTTATPEPSSFGLVGVMLLALGAFRRRARSR